MNLSKLPKICNHPASHLYHLKPRCFPAILTTHLGRSEPFNLRGTWSIIRVRIRGDQDHPIYLRHETFFGHLDTGNNTTRLGDTTRELNLRSPWCKLTASCSWMGWSWVLDSLLKMAYKWAVPRLPILLRHSYDPWWPSCRRMNLSRFIYIYTYVYMYMYMCIHI